LQITTDRRYELNEVQWWANWSHLKWLTEKAYVLTSNDFNEPLFNHAGFISPASGVRRLSAKVAQAFQEEGTSPSYLIQRSNRYDRIRADLIGQGFKSVDQLSVMKLGKPAFKINAAVTVGAIKLAQWRDWCRTYLTSFYGDLELYGVVSKIVRKAFPVKGVKFVIARKGKSAVGALAMYESDRLVGIYCVGTTPKQRRKGVGGTMLRYASAYARRRKKTLILQTFLSEGFEEFYLNAGFKRLYLKDVFTNPP
jgi:N-acetylglutamate synthase-like GNAT family acetyltransferase